MQPKRKRSGATVTVLITVALATSSLVGCSSTPGSAPDGASAGPGLEADSDYGRALADVARRQGVGITWTGGPYRYRYDWGGGSAENPAEDDVALVAAALVRELDLYPDDFFRNAGLTGIVLAGDLFVEEDGGARGAAAYIFEDRFFLDVPLAARAVRAGTRVRFIHHLMWHRLDERAGTMWQDPTWTALNPPAFDYGVYSPGGVHETRAGSGSLSIEYPGFLNLYSTGNLPDDKAEVFAYLMVIHSWLAQRALHDTHLAAKASEVKRRLAALDPAFNEDFWDRISGQSDDPSRYGAQR